MKIKHSKQRGYRYMHSTQKVDGGKRLQMYTHFDSGRSDLWYCRELDKWMLYDDIPKEYSKCTADLTHSVHSIKAAIRYIKRHNELKKDNELMLYGSFIGIYCTFKV